MIKLLACIAAVALSANVFAQSTPKGSKFDSRVTNIKYNPLDVVKVKTKIGYVTVIQLERGEQAFPEVGVGDSEAWGFSMIENSIFLKPVKSNPNTNLILSTNKGRTYVFDLVLASKPHYVVKLSHDKKFVKSSANSKYSIPCSDSVVNFNYNKWGDDSIAPANMWDDGRFTCLKFKNNSQQPVVYQVASDGVESLANFHFEQDVMVIHSISNEFRVRLGDRVLGLVSEHAKSKGYNYKATSIDAVRGIKDDS